MVSGKRSHEGSTRDLSRREVLANFGSDNKQSRRSVVHGIFGGLLSLVSGVFGATGLTNAQPSVSREARMAAARDYDSTKKIRRAIEEHASNSLKELSESGVLNSRPIAELPLDVIHRHPREYAAADDGVITFGIEDEGSAIAKIQVTKSLSGDRQLTLVVVPELEHSFAVVESSDASTTHGKSYTTSDVTTQDCGACYHDEHCWVGCGPYSCECLIHKVPCCSSVGCDDCCYVTNTVFGPCSEDGLC